MNNAVKYALVGAAAYLAYQWWKQQQQQTAPPPATGTETGGGDGVGTKAPTDSTQTPTKTTNGTVTKTSLLARARAGMPANWDGKATADQWNYLYTDLSHVLQTADLFPAGNRGYLMTVDEYWQKRQTAGLSGIGMGDTPHWSVWLT